MTALSITKQNAWALLFFLTIDILILSLFLWWAYVTHYKMTDSLLYDHLLFSKVDFSLMEIWGYLKELLIIAVALKVTMRRPDLFSLAYAILFVFVLLDDSLQLHEKLGEWLAHSVGLGSLGFLAAPLLLNGVPFLLMLAGYALLLPRDRPRRRPVALMFCVLAFLAVALDHMLDAIALNRMQTVSALLEDGGELICLTLILVLWLRILTDTPAGGDSALMPLRPTGHVG